MFLLNVNGAGLAGQAGFGWPVTWDQKVNGGNSNVVVLGGPVQTYHAASVAAAFVRKAPLVLTRPAVVRAGFY